MRKTIAAIAVALTLTACGGSDDTARTATRDPAASQTGIPVSPAEAAAEDAEFRRLKPSMATATAILKSMPLQERKATLEQLKCMAQRSVEAGRTPNPRTVETVARARAMARRAKGGGCAREAATPGVQGPAMGPASSKAGSVGPAATGAERPVQPRREVPTPGTGIRPSAQPAQRQ
jgi:hypothetical protein